MKPLAAATPVIFILVRDRAKAKAFYQGVLGLVLVSEDEFADSYDLAGIPLRLTTVAVASSALLAGIWSFWTSL